MRVPFLKIWFAAALLFGEAVGAQQDSAPISSTKPSDFFSGFVVAANAGEITVNRKGLGKETAATRTFRIDTTTKVEGAIKPKVHVTVRFVADENGARAVHIIVR